MAFDKKPSTWIANYTADATNITLPIATFPEITAATEVDETDGDIRKTLFAIMEYLWLQWVTINTAGNAPTKMTISRVSVPDDTTDTVTKQYTFTFVIDTSGQEVDDE